MAKLVIGVGAGIAAFKSATLVSRLVQAGHQVRVVMTPASQQFIGASTLSALSGAPVACEGFDPERYPLGPHIEIIEDAELLIVAPATADLLGKFAHGIADTLLTTLWLQADCPTLLAPAMSNHMWDKPAVQRNVAQLEDDGARFVGPEEGWLSCRKRGAGRMSEPETIQAAAEALLA